MRDGDPAIQDPNATFVIAKSRWALLKTVPVGLLLAGASYYTQTQDPADSPMSIVGQIGVWFFGLGSLFALVSVFLPRPSVRLSPECSPSVVNEPVNQQKDGLNNYKEYSNSCSQSVGSLTERL